MHGLAADIRASGGAEDWGKRRAKVLCSVEGWPPLCVDIPDNLLVRERPGWCSLEAPHGAPREITDRENNESGYDVGIAAP